MSAEIQPKKIRLAENWAAFFKASQILPKKIRLRGLGLTRCYKREGFFLHLLCNVPKLKPSQFSEFIKVSYYNSNMLSPYVPINHARTY